MTSNPGLSQLSPYLNFDPAYLQTTQPEFIALEGASQKRGRFELAFSQIGGKMHVMVFKFVYGKLVLPVGILVHPSSSTHINTRMFT